MIIFLITFASGQENGNQLELKDGKIRSSFQEKNEILLIDNCSELEDYFVSHCPIAKGDHNGCCLCTQVSHFNVNDSFAKLEFFSSFTTIVSAAKMLCKQLEWAETVHNGESRQVTTSFA